MLEASCQKQMPLGAACQDSHPDRPPSARHRPAQGSALHAARNRKIKVPRRTLRHPSSHLLTLFRWGARELLAL